MVTSSYRPARSKVWLCIFPEHTPGGTVIAERLKRLKQRKRRATTADKSRPELFYIMLIESHRLQYASSIICLLVGQATLTYLSGRMVASNPGDHIHELVADDWADVTQGVCDNREWRSSACNKRNEVHHVCLVSSRFCCGKVDWFSASGWQLIRLP
jgi:hypothetical protein